MRTVNSLHELDLPEKHSHVIRTCYEKISRLNSVDRIILFGSCAKGQAGDQSDIDLFYDDAQEWLGTAIDLKNCGRFRASVYMSCLSVECILKTGA